MRAARTGRRTGHGALAASPHLVCCHVWQAAETKMCDGALTAFRRAVREISRSAKLQAFNKNEEILKYFDGDYQTVRPPRVPCPAWTPHATSLRA